MARSRYFELFDSAHPKLPAGRYELIGNQELSGEDKVGATAELRSQLTVRSCRYRLPPDQVLSVWPAANEEGAFDSRLPQIVLRRRTLPWERRPEDPADEQTPWLALVVIAEGEGSISGEVPAAECITPGKTLAEPSDSPTGFYLAVTKQTIEKVFPTKEDLRALTHVRKVDLADTELALGDDDGHLAVVMANRLPQFDRVAKKPVRYMACLINLEQQIRLLPDSPKPVKKFKIAVDKTILGAHNRAIERIAFEAPDSQVADMVRLEMAVPFKLPTPKLDFEPMGEGVAGGVPKLYRFPVLTYWSFTCTESGNFESLMQKLDVGAIGAPPPPSPEPPTRPAPKLDDRKRVDLEHRDRDGEGGRAWFRGPLAPAPVKRKSGLVHVSEKLRRPGPEGREDLSYAAAFEIGRLLTLAQPSVVARLMRWRREEFGAESARRKAELAIEPARKAELLSGVPEPGKGPGPAIGRVLGAALMERAAESPQTVLGPTRPLVDPGRPLELGDRPLPQILAERLDLRVEEVQALMKSPGLEGGIQ
ncbi:MAG TPA: hypothetical protein VFJ76_01245 [Solirubrobacterales bacterium]|nr:hypothetical protein [Solirubrobacterales bacterium]